MKSLLAGAIAPGHVALSPKSSAVATLLAPVTEIAVTRGIGPGYHGQTKQFMQLVEQGRPVGFVSYVSGEMLHVAGRRERRDAVQLDRLGE